MQKLFGDFKLLRTRVKICGIKSVEDASFAESLGVDTIGLVFYEKSPRSVTLQQAIDISDSVGGMMGLVALFYNSTAEEVNRVHEKLPQVLSQFHGNESVEFCEQFDRPYIKAFAMGKNTAFQAIDVEPYGQSCAILLDANIQGQMGGTGERFDWRKIPETLAKPLILAGGLKPENVAEAIVQTRPYAVDVSSGVESGRGIKDQRLMQQFVENVRGVDCDRQ